MLQTVLTRLSPRRGTPPTFETAVSYLELPIDAKTLIRTTDGIGILCIGSGVVSGIVLHSIPGVLLAISVGVLVILGGEQIPVTAARARRTAAIGDAPAIVSRAVLQLRITPNIESAVVFAADHDGILASSLSKHILQARGTPQTGLSTFAAEWRPLFPALYRAVLLVEAASETPATKRDRTLDRAMDAILRGTQGQVTEATEALRGPTTAVYAFGVLLPLALVAILPAVGAAGLTITVQHISIAYLGVLPLALLSATAWLIATRPVAFPPVPIPRTHQAVQMSPLIPIVAGIGGGMVGWLGSGVVGLDWARPLAALGFGLGIPGILYNWSIVSVRTTIDDLEAALPDAMYLLGRRVADGIAVERALSETAPEIEPPLREVLEDAARRIQHLRIDVDSAFNGEFGTLRAYPSPRLASVATLLDLAAQEGVPAGRTMIETADHLDALQQIEQEARRELQQVTSTLTNTATVFGPLVGGVTVALAGLIGDTSELGGTAMPPSVLGQLIGVYVLFLACVLPCLAVGLSRGFDRATIGYRIGWSLCLATVVYLGAFLLARGIPGGL